MSYSAPSLPSNELPCCRTVLMSKLLKDNKFGGPAFDIGHSKNNSFSYKLGLIWINLSIWMKYNLSRSEKLFNQRNVFHKGTEKVKDLEKPIFQTLKNCRSITK